MINVINKGIIAWIEVVLLSGFLLSQEVNPAKTFCNPLNLNYRFMIDAIDAREAADPVIILFKGDYYLFASRSGGYWFSSDFRDWKLVIPTGLPIEDYAPAILVIDDSVYYTASGTPAIYVTADPKNGIWKKRANTEPYGDPDLFQDDDGRVYMYSGVSNVNATKCVELDVKNGFEPIGVPVDIVYPNAKEHGWERRGDDNLLDEKPWIEGCWMTKYNGKYYLQYSAPGTEFKSYADGIYLSDKPLGPFTYMPYSPFSIKPNGFVTGAGHACTFKDKTGNWWRIVTMVVSVKHDFERRLGLFPVGFDKDGQIFTNTIFGDYPQYLPDVKTNQIKNNFTGWMLLSNKKYAEASSTLPGYSVQNAVDEDIKSYWVAKTGNADEWLMIDLGKVCKINAIQINFGEHNTIPDLVQGRANQIFEQYKFEISSDNKNWLLLIDKSTNQTDVPHDYIELIKPISARYIKLINVQTPGKGNFCVRDFRIFGNPDEVKFTNVKTFSVNRDSIDSRNALVKWEPVANADGYIVKYGIAPDKSYNHYLIYDEISLAIHSLNKGIEYFFSVEAFDNGTEYYYGGYNDVKDMK
ncbi:MAG: family 43 glycosylhydrolase [Ignavibacteriales bacterium]|nr:family 43 glycosylhydrolase [Ignavibacteriales bacterium]